MSYEEDVVIDETALDVEWLDQPRRMSEYCRLAAHANRTMDLAKENMEYVRAALVQQIRRDPKEHGIEPGPRGITEGMLDAAILLRGEFRMANKTYIDAKFEHDIAVSIVRAFDHRKSALENLVRLHGQSYFAGPSVPHDLSDMRAQRERELHKRIRIRQPDQDANNDLRE